MYCPAFFSRKFTLNALSFSSSTFPTKAIILLQNSDKTGTSTKSPGFIEPQSVTSSQSVTSESSSWPSHEFIFSKSVSESDNSNFDCAFRLRWFLGVESRLRVGQKLFLTSKFIFFYFFLFWGVCKDA